MEAKLNHVLERATANNALPGVAASIVDSKGNRLYHKAFGVNDISSSNATAYTTSTPTMIWSCTKLLGAIAGLQLIEQGKIALDDPVSKYVPEITNIGILDGTDGEGKRKTRPRQSEILIRHLFTHTSGFGYDFFDPTLLEWTVQAGRQPATYLSGSRELFNSPAAFEAGEAFRYGIGIDWLGFVVEAVTKVELHEYITKNITQPLGMVSTVSHFAPGQERLILHVRGESGKDALSPYPDLQAPANPEVHGAGAYLVSTLDDYSTLLATLLNKGTSPTTHASILKPETVKDYLFQDLILSSTDKSSIMKIPSAIPMLTNEGALLPGQKLGWSAGFLVNLEDIPGGRSKNSGMWAGLGNLFYWVDPEGDRAGIIMTSVFPFLDREVLKAFEAIERVAYGGDIKEGAEAQQWSRVDS